MHCRRRPWLISLLRPLPRVLLAGTGARASVCGPAVLGGLQPMMRRPRRLAAPGALLVCLVGPAPARAHPAGVPDSCRPGAAGGRVRPGPGRRGARAPGRRGARRHQAARRGRRARHADAGAGAGRGPRPACGAVARRAAGQTRQAAPGPGGEADSRLLAAWGLWQAVSAPAACTRRRAVPVSARRVCEYVLPNLIRGLAILSTSHFISVERGCMLGPVASWECWGQ